MRKTNRLTITIMSVLILANSSITASPFVYAEQNEVSGKKTMKSEISQANISGEHSDVKQTNIPNNQNVKKATEAVKLLFDEIGAKTSNTQAKINEVKLQVMELTESVQKTKLFEKIVQAQEMYDSKQTKMTNSKEKNGQKEFDEKTPSCTIDPYIYGNVYMTGAYEGEINQFELIVGDKEYTPGFTLLPNNQFKLYIGKKIPPSIFSVTVKIFDKKGKETSSQNVSVQAPKLTINNYTLGENYVKGEFIGDVAKFKLRVGTTGSTKEYTPGFRRLANNQFEVYAKDKILRGSKRVVLVALNSEGDLLKSGLVRVQSPYLDINDYKLGNEVVDRLFFNGKPSTNNTQNDINTALNLVHRLVDGPYKDRLLAKVQEAQKAYNDAHIVQDPAEKQAVEAVNQLFNGDTPKESNTQEAIDEARRKVDAVNNISPVKAQLLKKLEIAQAALDDRVNAFKVDVYHYGNVHMTGEYSGKIKKFKLIVDGKEYTPGFKLLANNKFQLYIGKRIPSTTKTVTVKSFDSNGKETGTREVAVQSPKLTVEEYTVGKDYIKGQIAGEAKQFKLIVDGKEYTPGFKLLENNNFEVYAKNKVTVDSKKVILKVLNAEGIEIGMQEITLNAPSLVVDYYKVNTDYITGSVTGNVKKFKLIVDGKEYFPGFKLLKNNRFEVYAKNKVSATSKTITLVSLDEQGKEILSKQVSILNSAIEDALTIVNKNVPSSLAYVKINKSGCDILLSQPLV
ncbi:immunoglobulin-like domain-containing protein [Enterococcus hirae]